jgi:hypothetical protein
MIGLGIISVLVGIFLILVWRGVLFPKLDALWQNLALIGGVVFVVAGFVGMGWLPLGVTPTAPTDEVPTGIVWEVSDTESLTHLVPISNQDAYEVRVTFNDTSNLIEDNTQFVVVNFTIERADSNIAHALTSCELSNIGTFTAITGTDAGETKEIIALNAQGEYAVTWTKNSGDATGTISETDTDTSFPREADHRDGWCSVNVTINAAAMDLMSAVGDSTSFTLTIAGTDYDFIVRLNTLNT